jgi:hypothetical protein
MTILGASRCIFEQQKKTARILKILAKLKKLANP